MDRNELTMAIAGTLFGAVLLGWILRWMFGRLNSGSGPRSIKKTAEMAARLHHAEEARATSEARQDAIEDDLRRRLVELQAELDATHEDLARARAQADEVRAAYREVMEARPAES